VKRRREAYQFKALGRNEYHAFKHTRNMNLFCLAIGEVVLLNDHEVCKKGDVLTPEQARILVGGCTSIHVSLDGEIYLALDL
jgi:hypothetical protein